MGIFPGADVKIEDVVTGFVGGWEVFDHMLCFKDGGNWSYQNPGGTVIGTTVGRETPLYYALEALLSASAPKNSAQREEMKK
ncbi:MAG TPA: hypothetical protein VJJ52_01575 [Candidatus Nanoarchaeia archaeon]|nr:hypothetical protein [Candidatus Nanoarchaeia archaeon]